MSDNFDSYESGDKNPAETSSQTDSTSDCVFCKIVKKETDSKVVFEVGKNPRITAFTIFSHLE